MELIQCIKDGDVKKIRNLSEYELKFNEDLTYVDEDNMTPLHHACKLGMMTVVKLLLTFENAKKALNLKDKKGWTPLVYAIYSQDDGGPEVVELLIERGCDPNIRDNEDNTPIHHAAGFGAGDTIELLAKNKKSDLNAQNNKGETPLHLAIRESQMWAFQMLIKNGARTDIVNNDQESLIHYAVNGIGNSLQFIRTLASKGVDLNLENKWGETALDVAKKKNLTRVANLLLELGAKEKETAPKQSAQTTEKPVAQKPKATLQAAPQKKDNVLNNIIIVLVGIALALLAYKILNR